MTESPSAARPLRVLTVDDHPASRLLLKQQLIRLGYEVVEAENGEQALERWNEQHFDMVITDSNMPVMDGLSLTRLLRERQQKSLIILGLTANAQPEERSRCIAAGMDDCLFKPLNLKELETGLQRTSQKEATTGSAHPESLSRFINLDNLRSLTGHDNILLFTLLNATRDENQRDMQPCLTLAHQEDWAALAYHVHRLAGAADIIGANTIAQQCRSLEKVCEGATLLVEAEILPRLQTLLADLAALNQAISAYTTAR
ncbi:response regulator [Citrobacter koseri]|uniref:response regulator n=1 Tax=Citrobacter koseri TaxID=545 RepID=UPI0040414AC9